MGFMMILVFAKQPEAFGIIVAFGIHRKADSWKLELQWPS